MDETPTPPPPAPRSLQFLVWVPLCLALAGSMNRGEFVIYPEGLQEVAAEYVDGFEQALAGDDEAGLAWLYARYGAEADTVDTEVDGPMDVANWTRLLGHDPEAMGTAWGAGEALMYAEVVEAASVDQWTYEVGSVTDAHARSSALLTAGMYDAVTDNLVDVEALQQIAMPSAYEAFSSVLALLDIDPSVGGVRSCGIDYLSEWESDFSLDGAHVEPLGAQGDEEDLDPYPDDVVGRQLFELLTRAGKHDTRDVQERATSYYVEYVGHLDSYVSGAANR